MDLRWFEDALVLLEERNMTRAALRRNITQPAFSRRIRSFEHWLGTPLLDRRANSIELNPSLLASEADIRALILRIEELRHRIRTFTPDHSHLSIATQHALIFSAFPDIAALVREHHPNLSFRLRSGNRNEVVSWFLRRDASVLLCYEEELSKPLPFDDSILRDEWGYDRLIPVVGGILRHRHDDALSSDDLPAIVYPERSYFGEILSRAGCRFSTPALSPNLIFETAFSAGIKDLVLKGLGIAWLPVSMVCGELESGTLEDLSECYGSVTLRIVVYTDSHDEFSNSVRKIWLGRNQ